WKKRVVNMFPHRRDGEGFGVVDTVDFDELSNGSMKEAHPNDLNKETMETEMMGNGEANQIGGTANRVGKKRKTYDGGIFVCGKSDEDGIGSKGKGSGGRGSHQSKKVARRRRRSSMESNNDLHDRLKVNPDECKVPQVSASSEIKGGMEVPRPEDNSVCSYENMKKIGEKIGVIWDDCDSRDMKIISLNIRGLKRKGKVEWLQEFIRSETPCVVGLQETKCRDISEQWIEEIWGSRNFGFAQADAIGKSGGLLLIWDTTVFTGIGAFGSDRFVAVRGNWKGVTGDVVIANIYGAHSTDQKVIMWNKISTLLNSVGGAWCLFGDFNDVRVPKRLNSHFNTRDARNFNDFIQDNSLVEIQLGGRRFTRISDDGLKFSKLDCFLVTADFCSTWGNLSAITLDRKHSDHCPIILRDLVRDFGPKPFRSFNVWLADAEIGSVVNLAWEKPVRAIRPDCVVRDKLKNVKEVLKRWSKTKFGDTNQCIETNKREAIKWEAEAELRNLSDEEMRKWGEARKAWPDKENEKADMLKHKARVKWDDLGGAGFKAGVAIFRRRGEVIEAVRWFWDKGELSKGCNASFVTLIPKVVDPMGLGDFRPISLIGSYYKIIAKLLAERVKKIVEDVIGEPQNAFIKGRYILDGVLIANETMEYLKKKKRRADI
ncbi:RNA-directed DNA polymerase, eukaryota, partial [Tanacetum coccineum]